jgi:hypothetical protein
MATQDDSSNSLRSKFRIPAFVVKSYVSSACEALLTAWKDRLRPSFPDENSTDDDYVPDLDNQYGQSEAMLRSLFVMAVYHIFEQHLIGFFYHWAKHELNQNPNARPQFDDCR